MAMKATVWSRPRAVISLVDGSGGLVSGTHLRVLVLLGEAE